MLQCFSYDPLNKVFETRIIGYQLKLEKMSQNIFFTNFGNFFQQLFWQDQFGWSSVRSLFHFILIYSYELVSKCNFESQRPRALHTFCRACDFMHHLNGWFDVYTSQLFLQ